MYIAKRRMNVDGEVREPGDAVPEAAAWPNLRAYLGSHLDEVPDEPAPTATPTTEAPPVAAAPGPPLSGRVKPR